MKKVKLTVNEGSAGRTLYLFGEPEGAYVWVTEAGENPAVIDTIPDVECVVLLPGDFIEAEWRGCEYDYDGQQHTRIDFVRLAKATPTQNSSGMLVSIHYGWTHDCIIPFRQYKDDDISAVMVPADEPKQLDLALLFKDSEDK